MIHIAICDDNITDLKKLKLSVQYIMDKLNLQYDIEEFNSGEKLLLASKSYDLVFLDIMMKEKNGIEVGKLIYRKNRYTKVIYQTSFVQYCQEAMNKSHAFAFLEKPVQTNLLEEQIKEFIINRKKVHVEFKNVKFISDGIEIERPLVILPVNDIIYFEYVKSRKKVAIVTGSQRYIYSETMKSLEERMNPLGFEVSCRGLLVNIGKIMKIKGYTILMNNGERLPLSQRRVSEFKERMNEFIHNSY